MKRRGWTMGVVAALALGALAVGVGARARPARALGEPPPIPAKAQQSARAPRASAPAPATAAPARELAPPSGSRLVHAEQALDAYLAYARYPPSCRPIAEKPDLVLPHRVSAHTLPLAHAAPEASGRARVTLRQDRYYASADESVSLGISCAVDGAPAACEVLSASAASPPDTPAEAGPATLIFADDGEGGVGARLQPSAQGFAAYHGAIRVTVRLRAGGDEGSAMFDVDYTPAAPATFTGAVHEALVEGSLDLDVGLSVARPGRYFVRARVEDAAGRPFAFLSESAVLAPGVQGFPLRLFGKVVTDAGARAPFRLRDLEGFLLLPDASPDRATIPARDGVVYTTRAYSQSAFSPAEWESETKSRQVGLLERQLDTAARAFGSTETHPR